MFGIDRIVGNHVRLAIFACLSTGKLRTETSSVSSFVTSATFCFQNSTKSVLLGIDILYVLLSVLYRNKNRRNSPKTMHRSNPDPLRSADVL